MIEAHWKSEPFSSGNYVTDDGWRVSRWHDERDNFYVVSHNYREIREFRNDMSAAFRFADKERASLAHKEGTETMTEDMAERLQHAQRRVHILEEDGAMFGLVPSEEAELAACKALIARAAITEGKKGANR